MTPQGDLGVRALEYGESDTYTGREMGRRKTSGPPRGKRANRPNMVAAAIELAGGPTAVAELCGVRRQSVYVWIKEWKVERLGQHTQIVTSLWHSDRETRRLRIRLQRNKEPQVAANSSKTRPRLNGRNRSAPPMISATEALVVTTPVKVL